MANEFYNRGATFNPDELADGDAIEAEFDAVSRGFDTIEELVNANMAGYPSQTFYVAPAVESAHAIQKAQLDSAVSDLTDEINTKLDAVDYNAPDVLAKMKTVDGAGSGLDADLLDGLDSSQFIRSDAAGTITGALTSTSTISATQFYATSNGAGTNVRVGDDAWFGDVNTSNTARLMGVQDNTNGYLIFGNGDLTALGRSGNGALTYGGNTIWHAGNDGSSSGLDADMVDGQHGSYYRDASNINAGTLAKERLPGTIDSATTGNAATATKVSGGAPVNGDADLVTGTMGSNDFFRIRVGGTDNAGWVELATADDGNEPILVRQYIGQFGSVARTLTLLDGSGNTVIPCGVWSIPNNAFLNTVSVITGTVYHGNWLPIPDGYSEGQCRFFISMNNTNPYDNSWDLREEISTQHYSEYCRLINNRQVEAFTRVYNDVNDAFQYHDGIVNYIVIGVK